MQRIKLFEGFINESVSKYNIASNAREIYYLCKNYDVNIDDMAKLFKDQTLKEYLKVLGSLDISKFKEGDIVEVLDGKYKGKIGEVSRYEYIDDYLRSSHPKGDDIGVYVSKLNSHEAASIELAKTWDEVPSATIIPQKDLKIIKKK